MAQDIRSVVDDIITTYELRIKEIGDKLKEKGTQLVDYFRNERTNLTQKLESILAKKVHLRRKDFRLMMQDIESYQIEREKRVKQLIEYISEEERKMIQGLKKLLTTNPVPYGNGKVDEAIKIMTNHFFCHFEHSEESQLVEKELIEFEREKEELSLQLKRLLEKADSLRIKDFKKTLKRLKAKKSEVEFKEQTESILFGQQKLHEEVEELLNNFRCFQHLIEKSWQKEIVKVEGGECHEI